MTPYLALFFAGFVPLAEEILPWKSSLAEALLEAKRRNAPLVLLLTEDKNPDCEDTLRQYRSRKFLDYGSKLVFVVGHKGAKHEAETKAVNGKPVAFCRMFQIPCEEHERCWQEIWKQFITKEFWYPVQIFLHPDGRENYRFTRTQDPKLVLQEFERLLKAAESVVPKPEYDRALEEIEKAKREAQEGKAEEGKRRILGLVRKSYPESMKKFLEEEAGKL